MTQTSQKSEQRPESGRNPAVERLMSEAESFLFNKANSLVGSLGDRVTDGVGKLESLSGSGVKEGVKSLAGGDSAATAGLKAGGAKLKDKVSGLFGGKGSGGSSVKATNINESIDVGVPVSVAYNQWTQFEEFGSFMKGVQSVEQKDETTTSWKAKVALSTRAWESTIKEQTPDERIAWSSQGAKGTVDGVVTFHELAPNLTRIIVELEYSPKGLFEKTGNLWRAQGRRARLDLKHFRRFVMMRGEETGAWRGRIEDSEVVESSEDEGGSGRSGGSGNRGRSGNGGRGSGQRGKADRSNGRQSGERSKRENGQAESGKAESGKAENGKAENGKRESASRESGERRTRSRSRKEPAGAGRR